MFHRWRLSWRQAPSETRMRLSLHESPSSVLGLQAIQDYSSDVGDRQSTPGQAEAVSPCVNISAHAVSF